jgi:tRNA threonylcarbamoyladenosine biosynthesis protein TsaE
MMIQRSLSRTQATQKLGETLYQVASPPVVIYLQGELGSGKTTLVQGFLREAKVKGSVKSPTYTLVESYELPDYTVHHFDLYRVQNPSELLSIGIEEYFDVNTVCFIEWPERGEGVLPPPDLTLQWLPTDKGRLIQITAHTPVGERMEAGL